jgi:hypothetical protein
MTRQRVRTRLGAHLTAAVVAVGCGAILAACGSSAGLSTMTNAAAVGAMTNAAAAADTSAMPSEQLGPGGRRDQTHPDADARQR